MAHSCRTLFAMAHLSPARRLTFVEPGEGTPLLEDPGWELYPSLSPDDRFLA